MIQRIIQINVFLFQFHRLCPNRLRNSSTWACNCSASAWCPLILARNILVSIHRMIMAMIDVIPEAIAAIISGGNEFNILFKLELQSIDF